MEFGNNTIVQQSTSASTVQKPAQQNTTQKNSAPVQEVKTQVEVAQEKSNDNKPLTQEKDVQDLVDTLNKSLSPFNTSIRFGFDSSNDVFFVSVIDSSTNDLIRRFPAEQAESLVGKMNEIVGIIFDEKG